jgi:hypothetical protein
MSKLRRADYTADLKGETITRCEWMPMATSIIVSAVSRETTGDRLSPRSG